MWAAVRPRLQGRFSQTTRLSTPFPAELRRALRSAGFGRARARESLRVSSRREPSLVSSACLAVDWALLSF